MSLGFWHSYLLVQLLITELSWPQSLLSQISLPIKRRRQDLFSSLARSLLKEFHPFGDAKHLLGVSPFCEPLCNIPLVLHLIEKPRLIK